MKWSGPGPQERSKPDEGPTNVALDKPLQRRIDDRGRGRYLDIPLACPRNRERYTLTKSGDYGWGFRSIDHSSTKCRGLQREIRFVGTFYSWVRSRSRICT